MFYSPSARRIVVVFFFFTFFILYLVEALKEKQSKRKCVS